MTRYRTRSDFENLNVRAFVSIGVFIGRESCLHNRQMKPRSRTSEFTRQKQQHDPLQNVDDMSHSMIPASAVPQILTIHESDLAKV